MAFELVGQGVVAGEYIIGRKAICAFLDDVGWQTVRRWRIKYGLRINYLPNKKPVLRVQDAVAFMEGRANEP